MKTVSLFCGAASGHNIAYTQQAIELTEHLVNRDITILYGGGSIGLMGAIADHALSLGGKVIGVIPEILARKELTHQHLTEIHLVNDMLERKRLLTEMADAFIALPGGLGTLDELFEVLVLNQIGYHSKPVALLNTRGYYDHLEAFVRHALSEGFINPNSLTSLTIEQEPVTLLNLLTKLANT